MTYLFTIYKPIKILIFRLFLNFLAFAMFASCLGRINLQTSEGWDGFHTFWDGMWIMAYILFPLVMFGHTLGRIPVLSILFRMLSKQLRKQHLAIPYYGPRPSVRSPASSMMEMMESMEHIALHSTLSEKNSKVAVQRLHFSSFQDYCLSTFRSCIIYRHHTHNQPSQTHVTQATISQELCQKSRFKGFTWNNSTINQPWFHP